MQVGIRNRETGLEKGWIKAIALVIGWLLILSLARDVWQIRSGFDRITDANERLEAEQVKNEALKDRLNLVMTEDYKEKLIREKLNMQKEGEILVVLPEPITAKDRENQENVEVQEENWKKWWALLMEPN